MEKAALGMRIREERLKKGYSQRALAKKADICEMYLSEIERGIKMPSLNSLIKIVEALEISTDYILRNEISCAQEYVYDEIAEKLRGLTPIQRKTAVDILEAYLRNLP